ncbi:cupin domain-containing protein [Peptococcaceae bacterium 1198_IL3148]
MKKLVCADAVETAAENGQKVFYVECNTIITPAARDLAKELGVEFADASSSSEMHRYNDSALGKKVCQDKSIDKDLIVQIVKAVLASSLLAGNSTEYPGPPFQAEGDPKSGLKIVRGRSVKYQPFDTGDPSANVAYREVISKANSQMSAGFLTIEKSSLDWELCCEEINIILEGNLSITMDGVTYEAYQGDVLFVPKGSKVTWSSSGYVKLFYVTYPANWSDLMAQP